MKNFYLTFLTVLFSVSLYAQSDVSDYFLKNAGFDLHFNYDSTLTGNVKGDIIQNIYGWDNNTEATYTVAGTFAYNNQVTFNNSSALPSFGYQESKGGALAMSTGWGMILKYSQTITLPAGKYRLASVYYNLGRTTKGSSLLAWIPTTGTQTASTLTAFPIGAWCVDTITFTLPAQTQGKIQIGFTAVPGLGSADQAKIIVDYVKLLCEEVDASILNANITEAESLYGDGTGVYADSLKAAIDVAKTLLNSEKPDAGSVMKAKYDLEEAVSAYRLKNATVSQPIDMSNKITNPSFESDFDGWTAQGMAVQTNTSFPRKSGSKYIESWTSIGLQVSDAQVEQTLYDMPNGKYRLTAACGNIQQKASNSVLNATAIPQTGVVLYVNEMSVSVDTMKDKTLAFVVENHQITLGFKAENATGNWIVCDNFRLAYVGESTINDYVAYLQQYLSVVRSGILTRKMQNTQKTALEKAVADIETLLGLGVMVQDDLSAAKVVLDAAIESAEISVALYAALDAQIIRANEVLGWYENEAEKAIKLQTAIAAATSASVDYSLSTEALQSAISNLQTVVASVDKKIYASPFGDIENENNQWSLSRSQQSKDWILFWEKDFGEDVSVLSCGSYQVKIADILSHAEVAFDFYADSLKFIQRSTSKTAQYKMVILCYYTTDWMASGSGVDNTIGQLNLSMWAAASREWQTLYHEIGHCFQYQTHCDNGNNNGWMYSVGNGCAFWEQCAQWQAYKILPGQQFTNEWYSGYLSNAHKHILHESPRYNNYFIQDYWTYKHGMDIIGRLWNESKSPEDAVQAYIRITGINITQFNDEIYDCAARFATWDLPDLRVYGASYFSRTQPKMSKEDDNYWQIDSSVCIENTGYNIIKLNPPTSATTLTACFEGIVGAEGYRKRNISKAGWRYGFVAMLYNGTRVYSEMGDASYTKAQDTLYFDCPDRCRNLYFVVTGAPSYYWPHLWDDDDSNDEQLPYKVKFNRTNRYGYANVVDLDVLSEDKISIYTSGATLHIHSLLPEYHLAVYDLTGTQVLNTSLVGEKQTVTLSSGIYIVKVATTEGCVTKKVMIR